jgi:hypothetical protein
MEEVVKIIAPKINEKIAIFRIKTKKSSSKSFGY